ncbi:hypothetical protein RJ639_041697 [Escallonia herrerae]|uniref:Retrotransposon gag domain-containing protein n=1 Tax=Escallonia herrerae TaxID=1293975 RepID=A0AA88WHW7_9ASTE|nr:hypothetical protein RJ639_041697 [Escallonia herrerae]
MIEDNMTVEQRSTMIWDQFKDLFFDCYFRWNIKEQMYRDFLNLRQGANKSIAEYEVKFTRLSCYPVMAAIVLVSIMTYVQCMDIAKTIEAEARDYKERKDAKRAKIRGKVRFRVTGTRSQSWAFSGSTFMSHLPTRWKQCKPQTLDNYPYIQKDQQKISAKTAREGMSRTSYCSTATLSRYQHNSRAPFSFYTPSYYPSDQPGRNSLMDIRTLDSSCHNYKHPDPHSTQKPDIDR